MEKFIVTTGKTIDLAVTAALQQLGMDRDSVSVEVLENAKSGFLGIGASPAKVKVTYEVPDEPKKPEAPMSVLSSASRSKPKERPEITSSIISRPGKKIGPEQQAKPQRRREEPRQCRPERTEKPERPERPQRAEKPERRKPQNAEAPKQQEKPAEKPARPEKQERPQAPKQEKPRAPLPEKAEKQQPAPAAPKEYAPAPEGSMEEKIEKFLTGLLTHMNSTAVPHAYRTEEGGYRAELVGGDVGMLIGRRGETLDAIQYLTSYAINRDNETRVRVSVDAGDYRLKREEALQHLAAKMAGKAVKYHRNFTLEPMNAYERHVIHAALQDYPEVTTFSTGSEPHRRIVVAYAKEK